jgi:hypothetical protein
MDTLLGVATAPIRSDSPFFWIDLDKTGLAATYQKQKRR